jgi:hypothetical protein
MQTPIAPMCLALALATPALAEEPISQDAVENAITEYVHAKYAGDAQGVQERTHHAISRYMRTDRYFGQPSDEWLRRFHWDNLRFYGTEANRTRHDNPDEGRLEIEVYDVAEWSAAAKVVMDDVVDLVHLVHFDGRWVVADSAVRLIPEAGQVPEQDRSEEAAVRKVVENYCLGFYHVDGQRVQDTCHTGLSKRRVEHAPEQLGGFDYMRSITYEEIKILGDVYNRSGHIDPATAPVEIEVYYVDDTMAEAKLVADGWFDYFQLFKVNGEWTIANIIFEPIEG